MRVFVVSELKHHSQMRVLTDVPEPQAKPGQVLVDLYSAGLNFFDVQPPLPFVLGTEFAGRISKDSPIPEGCFFKPGDRVFGAGQGAYADEVAINLRQLQPLPDAITYDRGAGLYFTWPTSYEALIGRAKLKPGQWILVTAAAGGVGIAAVQLAKVLDAKVIAAAGSEAKLDIVKRCGGADHGEGVLTLTNGKGADVTYDPVSLINDSLKCIAWKGRMLVVGFAAGTIEKVPMNLVLLKNISFVGLYWGSYSEFKHHHVPVVWKALLDLFASGQVKPVIYDQIDPLEQLADGLTAIERREASGKTIIRIREENDAKL
ncbi:alcohol dehydrogenase [Lyophyllum atratum]|nr:alcohol dehydrogenase [Lyophyllum atratum]